MVKKVLIVEDNMIISLDLEDSLRRKGFDVVGTVTSGEIAIQQLKLKSPDIVLMDIGLKGELDGIDTARKMHAICDVPIVFLSGNSDPATIDKANTVNYKDFLIKPVNMDLLLKALQ